MKWPKVWTRLWDDVPPQDRKASLLNPHFLLLLASLILLVAGIAVTAGAAMDTQSTWVHPEVVFFHWPNAYSNGTSLQWGDFLRGFDVWSFDGADRTRFLGYTFNVLNAKLRLFAYQWMVPPANLTPTSIALWLLTLPGMWLLARSFTQSIFAANLTAMLYATSVGFASLSVLNYQAGRTLLNIFAIALLLAAKRLFDTPGGVDPNSFRWRLTIPALCFFGMMTDECFAAFIAAVPVLFFDKFFSFRSGENRRQAIKNWTLLVAPLVAFVVFVLFVVPRITPLLGLRKFDVFASLRYAAGYSNSNATIPELAIAATKTLLLDGFVSVEPLFDVFSGATLDASLLFGAAVAFVVIAGLLHRFVELGRAGQFPFRILGAALLIFFGNGAVYGMAGLRPNGDYYGASAVIGASVLFAVLVKGGGIRAKVVSLCLAAALAIGQHQIFDATNRHWISGHNTYMCSALLNDYPVMESYQVPAIANQMSAASQRWRDGKGFNPKSLTAWPSQQAWFLVEMDALANQWSTKVGWGATGLFSKDFCNSPDRKRNELPANLTAVTPNGNGRILEFGQGWSPSEGTHRWMDAKEAVLQGELESDEVQMQLRYITPAPQRLTVVDAGTNAVLLEQDISAWSPGGLVTWKMPPGNRNFRLILRVNKTIWDGARNLGLGFLEMKIAKVPK